MSDAIETRILGDTAALRSLALALRDSTVPVVSSVGDTLSSASRAAGDTWNSPAGEAFHSRISPQIAPVDRLATFLGEAAGSLDHLAGELEQCKNLMQDICSDAAAAGLTVDGSVIRHPGPPLPAPGVLPPDSDAVAIEAHRQQTETANTQNAKVDAYVEASGEASEVRAKEETATRSMGDTVGRKHQLKVLFVGTDVAVGIASSNAPKRNTKHIDASKKLLERANDIEAKRAGITGFAQRRESFAEARRLRYESFRALADKPRIQSPKLALHSLGGALAVGGIAYDIAVLDKPWKQAAVSGGVGFGTSIATGMVIGSLVPIPFVGTVGGALAGAGVGLFTSGVVDEYFENDDAGVQSAIGAGMDAINGTASATKDLATAAWDALF